MAYTKTAWVEGGAPGISAANLNNLEKQYDEAVLWAKSFGLGDIAKSISITDLNDLDVTGFYSGHTLTNGPTAANSSSFYYVINIKYSATYRVQIAIKLSSTDTGRVYKRSCAVGVWYPWKDMVSVEDTDTNANGTYIKYSDGTMVCYQSNARVCWDVAWQLSSIAGNTYYYNSSSWIFPAAFLSTSKPVVMMNGDIPFSSIENHEAFNPSYTGCSVDSGIYGVDPRASGSTFRQTFYAIGVWK